MRTKRENLAARHLYSSKAIAIVAGLFVGGMGTMLIARLSGGVPVAVFNLIVLAPISATCLVWLLFIRKKKQAKIATWREAFGLSSVTGSVLVTAAFLAFIFLFTFDTEYAPGYSEEAFRAVEIGDSREKVLGLLGQPLRVYGLDGKVQSYSRSPSGSNYLMRDIVLDSEGRVVEIWKQIYWD